MPNPKAIEANASKAGHPALTWHEASHYTARAWHISLNINCHQTGCRTLHYERTIKPSALYLTFDLSAALAQNCNTNIRRTLLAPNVVLLMMDGG